MFVQVQLLLHHRAMTKCRYAHHIYNNAKVHPHAARHLQLDLKYDGNEKQMNEDLYQIRRTQVWLTFEAIENGRDCSAVSKTGSPLVLKS
jgi:hypothetical protein